MNSLVGALIVAGMPLLCLVSGAPLGQRLGLAGAAARLSASLLIGLCLLLLAISYLGLALPLGGWALVVVILPALIGVADRSSRRQTRSDLGRIFTSRLGLLLLAGTAVFLAALIWPLLTRGIIYYDGTANHDAFFWIVGADRLLTHNYLEQALPSASLPSLTDIANYTTGLRPEWGRIGAEGYLAIVAGLTRQSPLAVYLWAGAALYAAWLAAVYLTARNFIIPALNWPAVLALGALQPLFAFYQHNGNLPNLLGIICGATLVWATASGMSADGPGRHVRYAWGAVSVLSLHGMLVSYPEITPFVLLPCGLLVLRASLKGATARAGLSFAVLIALTGLAINPVTTIRAFHGFTIAATSAQAAALRPDFLARLAPAESLPAMLTLSIKSGHELGFLGGALVSLGLVGAAWFTVRHARDRWGTVFLLAGCALLLLYTATSGVGYGWQKSVQYSAIFLAAVLPVGACYWFSHKGKFGLLALVGLGGFYGYALSIGQLDQLKWSSRKALDKSDLSLAAEVARVAPTGTLIVRSDTFTQPFFAEMWLAYLLRDRALHFATAQATAGGYLAPLPKVELPSDSNVVTTVSRPWADTHEPDGVRIAQSASFVVLSGQPHLAH